MKLLGISNEIRLCEVAVVYEDNKKIALRWWKKSQKEDDVFDRFICLWIAFNALYGIKSGSNQDQIKSLIEELYDDAYDIILENIDFFYTPIKNLNPSIRRLDTSNYIRELKASSNNRDKLVQLMYCIYQVRCNLFHGGKTPDSDRDYKVVRNACKILQQFFDIYSSLEKDFRF